MTNSGNVTLAQRWQRLDKGQLIKWTVYCLLLVNWGYYAVEEAYIASHSLRQGGTWLDWAEEFATTIDNFAWFGLLFMLELETYVLDDELEKRWVSWSIHGMRLVCYLFLVHTVYARVNTLVDTLHAPQAEGISSICQVADKEISWGENYRYQLITADNCQALSDDTEFRMITNSVIMDRDAHELEIKHVWVDLSDVIMWLLVIWAIELTVWLQNRDITGGTLMLLSHAAKLGYAILFAHAAFWAWTGHWVWAWDQFLWIAGFWAIEKNLSDWREEIREEHPEPA